MKRLPLAIALCCFSFSSVSQDTGNYPAAERVQAFNALKEVCLAQVLENQQMTRMIILTSNTTISRTCECAAAFQVSGLQDTNLSPTAYINDQTKKNMASSIVICLKL